MGAQRAKRLVVSGKVVADVGKLVHRHANVDNLYIIM